MAGFEPGQIVGEYRIVRTLGRGGLGAVYEATHLISQRSDAMKVMLPEQTGTPEMAERFRREIQMLASLSHPHISGLHNAFHHDNQLIMIMELAEGEDLRSLSQRSRIALPALLGFAEQVLEALQYAHSRGVIHRDIKPANIMVSPVGQVKVLDFGIAIAEAATNLTAAGALIGSPIYMAPEQILGGKATVQSDIYSFGVTLYELIAGKTPIEGATTYELLMGHVNNVPVPLHQLRSDIPLHLSLAIMKALEKNPAQRFASALDFLADLQAGGREYLAGVTTVPVASWQRVSTDELRKPITASTTLPLEPVIRHLASFIGPIAKIVVNRLAKQCNDLDQLYAEAAKQIETPAERQRFLLTRPDRVS